MEQKLIEVRFVFFSSFHDVIFIVQVWTKTSERNQFGEQVLAAKLSQRPCASKIFIRFQSLKLIVLKL